MKFVSQRTHEDTISEATLVTNCATPLAVWQYGVKRVDAGGYGWLFCEQLTPTAFSVPSVSTLVMNSFRFATRYSQPCD